MSARAGLHHLAAGVLLVAVLSPPAFAAPPAENTGRVIVMPRAGLSEASLGRIVAPHGGRLSPIGRTGMFVLQLPANASDKAVAAQLARHPQLKFAEPDQALKADLAANDPYVGSAWHLGKIRTPSAWDMTMGAGITIAILDSGVDASHPDLAGRLVPGWNFYDNNPNTADVYGHGTKVAGAAAAATNNAVGVAAVAGAASIMPMRVTDTAGYGYASSVAQALSWAADRGARVANISFGFGGNTTVQTAAQYMKDKGGLVFVSAGNTGAEVTTAQTSKLLVVSATDSADAKASWSTYGSFVSLAAPGVDIYSTTVGGGYASVNGTSFAAPVTAGVAALVMAARPTLKSTEVEQILFSTAADLGTKGRDNVYGYGRVDADAAVRAATGFVSTADVTAPVVAIAAPVAGATVGGLVAVDATASDAGGIARVELRVNGSLVATDSNAPYGFSWDTTKLANGAATVAITAYDASGNAGTQSVVVNVSNLAVADTQPPVVQITSPGANTLVGSSATVTTAASDNAGAAGVTQSLTIDGKLVATGTGGSLSYRWNTRKLAKGVHTIQVTARDASGNTASSTVQVQK